MIRASIIIPTFNRAHILERTLDQLLSQKYQDPFEIIIIDDGSTDSTEDLVERKRRESTEIPIVYFKQKNKGASPARNRGITMSKGSIILFMDDDIFPVPSFVQAHMKAHESGDRWVVQGPVIHTESLTPPFTDKEKLQDISRAFFATGNTSLYREHLLESGGFDEDFHAYGWEDLELGGRLKRMGLKKIFVEEAKGFHYKEAFTMDRLPALKKREVERGRMAQVYVRKDPSFSTKMSTLYWTPFLVIFKILFLGGWPDFKITQSLAHSFERRGALRLRNTVVEFIKYYYYLKGLLRKREE